VHCDSAFALKIRLHYFHASREENKKRYIRVAGLKQNFTFVDAPWLADGADAIDLSVGENWERLGASIERARYRLRRHFSPLTTTGAGTIKARLLSDSRIARAEWAHRPAPRGDHSS
jgi:hypothetical protein